MVWGLLIGGSVASAGGIVSMPSACPSVCSIFIHVDSKMHRLTHKTQQWPFLPPNLIKSSSLWHLNVLHSCFPCGYSGLWVSSNRGNCGFISHLVGHWFSNCSFACMSSKYADCTDVPCCIHAPHRQMEVSEIMVLEFCDILPIYVTALRHRTRKTWYISSTCSSYILTGLLQCGLSKSTQRHERNDRSSSGISVAFNGFLPVIRTADTEFLAQ